MRKVGWVLGVGILSLPLVAVLWVLAAARWPKMDDVTLQMPDAMRAAVASAAQQNVTWDKGRRPALERITRLDPSNAFAWSNLCTNAYGTETSAQDRQACATAVSLDRSAENYNGLGQAQERAGDVCAAEESFTTAAGRSASSGAYIYVQNMGRAALRCKHLYASRAGFETAIELEERALKDPENDASDLEDVKEDMLNDREYLIVTLDGLDDAKASQSVCKAAHPQWGGCDCVLPSKGTVTCHEKARH